MLLLTVNQTVTASRQIKSSIAFFLGSHKAATILESHDEGLPRTHSSHRELQAHYEYTRYDLLPP